MIINKQNKTVVWVLAALALGILPLLLQSAGNFWVRIADTALLYVLLALGLNIVVGYAGLLDLGFVAFYAIGAYMFGLLASPHLTESFASVAAAFPEGLHMPLWVVIPAGGAPGVLAREPHVVLPRHAVARVGELVREVAVVGEQEQALGLVVEAAYREHPGLGRHDSGDRLLWRHGWHDVHASSGDVPVFSSLVLAEPCGLWQDEHSILPSRTGM